MPAKTFDTTLTREFLPLVKDGKYQTRNNRIVVIQSLNDDGTARGDLDGDGMGKWETRSGEYAAGTRGVPSNFDLVARIG